MSYKQRAFVWRRKYLHVFHLLNNSISSRNLFSCLPECKSVDSRLLLSSCRNFHETIQSNLISFAITFSHRSYETNNYQNNYLFEKFKYFKQINLIWNIWFSYSFFSIFIYLVPLFVFCWTGVDCHRNNYV